MDNPSLTPKIHSIIGVDVSCVSWSLEVNEHLICYEPPEEYYDEEDLAGLDTSLDIYCLRWYPYTPVGHCTILANNIVDLLNILKED